MSKERPLILVSNDDGISAPGIRHLIRLMKKLGDVFVVAPNSPQSGMSHAITLESMLFSERVSKVESKVTEYSCSGTPVDCVKLAMNKLLPRKPDLCVSGINHGANSSVNVLYSGTMAAALEGAIAGVPSIGFSLLDYSQDADFYQSEDHVLRIARHALKNGLPSGICLNVNIPKLSRKQIKGVKVCRQSDGHWKEDFDERMNPMGKTYYWLTGKFYNHDEGKDTDTWALENGYLSVVPVKYDVTAHNHIEQLNFLNHE